MPELSISSKTSLHYTIFNSNAPDAVVLLHGLGANGTSWDLQVNPLVDNGFCVICPDFRGFGLSRTTESTSIEIMANDIVSLMSHCQIPKASIVGISMGGTVALQLALDYPYLVESLILINTFAKFSASSTTHWLYFALRFFYVHIVGLPAQAKIVARRVFPNPGQEHFRSLLIEQITQANPVSYRSVMRSLAKFNVVNRIKEITAPTLVISGEDDTTVPYTSQVTLATNIQNCQHKIIQHAGHAASIDSHVEFNSLVINFLKNREFTS